MYAEPLKTKTQTSVLDALEIIRKKALKEGRQIKVLQTDNGKEFQNSTIKRWMVQRDITAQYSEKDDKKCLGVAERFNRTIKLMIEKYLTRMDSNRWIDNLTDFVDNYNSLYHSSIKQIPERLEVFDEVDLIRKRIKHNLKISDSLIQKGDVVNCSTKEEHLKRKARDLHASFTC